MNSKHILALVSLPVWCLGSVGLGTTALTAQQETTESPFAIEIELARLPSVSQGSTGTCWSFSTTSFLETELERMSGSPIDLSELHTVYYAYIEKAKRFVRLHGKTQFDQGGLCHDVMHIIDRYGLVPQETYTGLRDGATRHSHGELVEMLKLVVEKAASSRRPGKAWEDALREVLDGHLGPVPESITVRGKTLTPKQYARDVLRIRPADYRQVTSLAGQPFWKTAELLVPDNWMHHQDYWNVPVQEMLNHLDRALRKGYSAAIDIDNSEPSARRKGRNRTDVWTLPEEQEKSGAITDALRQEMFDDRRTTDDHLMHIVGIARHEDGRSFYLTKDSYGTSGPFRGHRMISRNYLMAKMLSFMVHKDALDPKLVARFEGSDSKGTKE